jgi:two-component system response regulator FlrC
MSQIGVSERIVSTDPALIAWLGSVGLQPLRLPVESAYPRDIVRILDAAEIDYATPRDIVLSLREGAPAFTPATGEAPARIEFGFEDMAFGHALMAETLRIEGHPACGERDSAAFLALAARIARADATVLVLGETGTGKEGLARFIHAKSDRAAGPFVAVNCAALPDAMLEAMLFGHQKGAFTGAAQAGEGLFRAAEGGTLLLDEIAEIPLALQAKLLRAIQEREVLPVGATRPIAIDVRIIAAANRDLATEVAEGRFRSDLYWRINVMPLILKPLAERRLDIRAITARLMLRYMKAGDTFPWPTNAALDRLMRHGWPGNVRELENVLQRAMLLRAGDRIEPGDLTIDTSAMATPGSETILPPAAAASATRLTDAVRRSEMQAIEDALAATGGHRLRAAERLGISERTLRYRLAGMRNAA